MEDFGIDKYDPLVKRLLKNGALQLPQEDMTVKKQKKCYIYTRVSTAIQVDGYSLDAQKDKLRKYAEYQDMTIAEEFFDEGHSGKNIKGRPEFVRMMEKIESGEDGVEYVLVFKLSRFGRNAADVLNSLQIMQDYGVHYPGGGLAAICLETGEEFYSSSS